MNRNLILIQCNDNVGLVALISQILASHNLNITAMREFVDEQAARFFTRIDCSGNLDNEQLLYTQLKNQLPGDADIVINPKSRKKIAILVTKEYHCLSDILARNSFNTLNAEVSCVIGNYDVLKEYTVQNHVPFHCISHEGKSKREFEAEITALLLGYEIDYIVLAKFMRILSPSFITQFSNRIINIHHSFLPAFIGARPYKQAFERGVKLIGATAHFVTNDLDEGPIIAQQTIPVNHTFGVAQMVTSGKEIEKAVLSQALKLVLEDRIFITGNKTIVFE